MCVTIRMSRFVDHHVINKALNENLFVAAPICLVCYCLFTRCSLCDTNKRPCWFCKNCEKTSGCSNRQTDIEHYGIKEGQLRFWLAYPLCEFAVKITDKRFILMSGRPNAREFSPYHIALYSEPS